MREHLGWGTRRAPQARLVVGPVAVGKARCASRVRDGVRGLRRRADARQRRGSRTRPDLASCAPSPSRMPPKHHLTPARHCGRRWPTARGAGKPSTPPRCRTLFTPATAFGRVASAAKAIELGYAVEPDDGPSGRLGHWRIAGMPEGACQLFSKRAAEITAAVESKGYDTYQARQTAARDTRKTKRHTPPPDLMDGWINELSAAGYTPEGLLDQITEAGANNRRRRPQVLSARQAAALAAYALGPSGRLAVQKVFTRCDVAVAVGPVLFGFAPRELLRAVEAVCGHPDAVGLMNVTAAREQPTPRPVARH